MKKVGHTAARTTITKTLKDNGIAPSPNRPTTWSTFLKSHAGVIAAADFFTVDVWTRRGPVTHYVLFVVYHATRAVHIAGVTPHPNSAFMAQVARNLTDSIDGFLRDVQFLMVDNDVLFTKQFCSILDDAGCEVVRTAIQAPNMNEQRPHQSLGNTPIAPTNSEPPDGEKVVVDERLGGLLRSYRRSA